MKKLTMLFLCLSIVGCSDERQVICDSNLSSTVGNLKIINRQCISFGDHPVGFIELEDTKNKKHYVYTLNYIDGHVVTNLSTEQAIQIEKSDKAERNAELAMSMAVANSVNRR